jgi:hypothetical protein
MQNYNLGLSKIMSNLFGENWMQQFAKLWNNDQEINDALNGQEFNVNIGYGFTKAPQPMGILVVKHGKVKHGGLYEDQNLDWDLRADADDWKIWVTEGLGLAQLGFVVSHKKLYFKIGDFRKMLRTPRLATAFLRSFIVMNKVR